MRLVPVPTIGQSLPLVYTTIAPGSDSTRVLGTFPFPAYDRLLVDATGVLWVRAPRTDGGSNWRPADLAT